MTCIQQFVDLVTQSDLKEAQSAGDIHNYHTGNESDVIATGIAPPEPFAVQESAIMLFRIPEETSWKTDLFFDHVTGMKGSLAQIQFAAILFRVFEIIEFGRNRPSTKDPDFVRLLGTDPIC